MKDKIMKILYDVYGLGAYNEKHISHSGEDTIVQNKANEIMELVKEENGK